MVISTLVYCIGPRLSQVEFSTVAVCVTLISQGQPSGKVCLALCLEWRAVYRHQPTVYREKSGQKEADLSSTGLGFWIIFIDFVDALWLCCWKMLMGWKARRTRCTYFKKKKTVMWNYDLQFSRHYTYFAMESRKQKHPGKVYHLCLPFDCIFHFESWTILPLI